MAFPPSVPVNTRSDATGLTTNHPADHNDISNALTDIVNELGSGPKGGFADLTARLVTLPFGEYEVTGAGVTLTPSVATTVDTISVTTAAAGLALIFFSYSISTSGVTYPTGSAFELAATIAGSSAISAGGGTITANAVSSTVSGLYLVPVAAGANTFTVQVNAVPVDGNGGPGTAPTGGTITVATAAKTAIIGAT